MAVQNTNYEDLYIKYDWLEKSFAPLVQRAYNEFFLEGFRLELLGIGRNVNAMTGKEPYFVTKIRIDKEHDMFFRVSERAVDIILNRALGKAGRKFALSKMTDLESRVITTFNGYVYEVISKFFNNSAPTVKRLNFDVIHMNFIIKDTNENTVARFIVTMPEVLLNPEVVVSTGEKFDYDEFFNTNIDTEVQIGFSRTSFMDMKHLSEGDIVVLENSNLDFMMLKFGDYETELRLNPSEELVLPFDNYGGNNMTKNANLWDSIEVDMFAQFDSIKMTLGDLKAIEEGQVIDLAVIYDNRVTLRVEEKAIAWGELVIINDRYGVKITEIAARSEIPAAQGYENPEEEFQGTDEQYDAQEFEENAAYTEEAVQQPAAEDEEFDYSDFELGDEDI